MSYLLHTTTSKFFQLTALSLALTLAGCGGGGTDTVAPEPDTGVTQPGTGGDGNNGDGNGEPTVPVSEVNVTPITLTDTNGNVTRTITSAGVSAKVVVTDETNTPIDNALVTFRGEGVAFGTSNAAILTNESGEASISVKPLDNTTTGSYQLSATVSANGLTDTTPGYNFSLQSVEVQLADIFISSTNLESGGNTNITLKTKDASSNANQNDIAVNFDTSCGSFDNDSVVSSNQGDVIANYQAIDSNGNLCEGRQTITITSANNPNVQRTLTVNIEGIEANSIVYTTTEETRLGANNSGSSRSGKIEFTVYANGRPAANQRVEISKVFAPNDFSFVRLGNQNSEIVTSDSQGRVVVDLYPSALPGPVEIKATLLSNRNIFALSKNVSVATGRATQNGFSLSLSKNVLAVGTDGDTATITARLVDRVGNPVPNGTVVSFISEGGRVIPNCATNNGQCSVEFSTQNPRPVDNRISVIAYVEGDKSYRDTNGDNLYTAGVDSLIRNIGDFFRDDNENNQYDSNLGEFVYRRNAGSLSCGPSFFSFPNINQTCDNQLEAILRSQVVLGLASDSPLFPRLGDELRANPLNNLDTPIKVDFKMYGNGAQTVSMPSGTSVSISAVDKTSFSPTVVITGDRIVVSNAEPNTTAVVKAGSSSINVGIGSDGIGSEPRGNVPADASLTVADTSSTCEAELVSGFETVPNIVDLGVGVSIGDGRFGKVRDNAVSYTFTYSGCRPNDQLKLSVTTPSPSATTSTKNITFVSR
ncbi:MULTISPECIES: Ig-like domain-containing protein [unclassified Psychrobacter]|uniref:hypothetical protein n=1 Tax=unclassified Psychrobacter TaxID=196806 RepID=UPI003FD0A069